MSQFRIFSVLIVLFAILTSLSKSNAECCYDRIQLVYGCSGSTSCLVFICADGTPLSATNKFCGVERCNVHGCDCVGGCRRNSKGYDEEEAKRLYRSRLGPS